MEKRDEYCFDIEKGNSILGAAVVMAVVALGNSLQWAA